MTAVARHGIVLNPFAFGLFSFQVWSHKVMRWLVPWFLVGLLCATAVLSRTGQAFWLLLVAQIGAVLLFVLVSALPFLRRWGAIRLFYYFGQVNLALAMAGVQFMFGRRIVMWDPSRRRS
jgi:hypothetical protein